MGSSDTTCAVSGLGIGGGDEVRYLLLSQNPFHRGETASGMAHYAIDHWVPRTFPLKAEFDDCGSVQDAEDGRQRQLWLDTLKLDLVARGFGDNQVHDLPTILKDLTFESLLDAVLEGRLLVKADLETKKERHRQPEGVPTRRVISDLLTSLGYEVKKDATYGKGLMVSRNTYRAVRIRSAEFGTTLEQLQEIANKLTGYATVVCAGSGSYADKGEILVFPRPGVHAHDLYKSLDEPLCVSHAMIREDVWQGILKMPLSSSWDATGRKKATVAEYREDAHQLYADQVKQAADWRGLMKERFKSMKTLSAADRKEQKQLMAFMLDQRMSHKSNGALVGLVTQQGFESLCTMVHTKHAWHRVVEHGHKWDPKELKRFLDTVGEFAFVCRYLYAARFMWHPSSRSGPQFTEFDVQAKTFGIYTDIAKKLARQQKADEDEANA